MREYTISLSLPEHFNQKHFLAFHGRDTARLAERVIANGFHKAFFLQGTPVVMMCEFLEEKATIRVVTDHDAAVITPAAVYALAYRILAMDQPVESFETQFLSHPELGQLITANRGLRIPQSPTAFEAISWAIIGQQISVAAAISIRRNFIEHVSSYSLAGLYCYPSVEDTLKVDSDFLSTLGFSKGKANALLHLCQAVVQKNVNLDVPISAYNVKEFSASLSAIKGIGPWTINYALLRGFNYVDGSLHGDVAVRRNLQQLLNIQDQVTPEYTQDWLGQFSPYRALAAAHLWSRQSMSGF